MSGRQAACFGKHYFVTAGIGLGVVVVKKSSTVIRANGISATGVFPIGKTYTALIAPARDGSLGGYVMAWTLPDGTKMDFWHDYGDGSQDKP